MDNWDVIIVGAGSAGCAAAIYTVRSGLRTLVLDEKFAGGAIADSPKIVNYPGFAEISGSELAQKISEHARNLGAQIHDVEAVTALDLKGEVKTVITTSGSYQAKAVIVATGSHFKEVGVKGETEFRGRGVSYCGVCDGPFFKGKRVMVVGGGNSACTTSLYLSGLASAVIVVHRRDSFRAEESLARDVLDSKNVTVLWNTEIQEIKGDKQVKIVELKNNKTGETSEVEANAVFIQVGEIPNSKLAAEGGVEINANGYIKIDLRQNTNIEGVFAAGDVTSHPVKQVGTAVGQGITAALEAYAYVRRPYYKR